jgi:regulator of sigma E protease
LDIILHNILPFVGVLVVLVVVHELGHYLTAKMFGVKVLEFGIGYPPRLFGFRRGETEYTVNVLPLGGFVRLLGEEDPSDPRSLAAQPAPQRLVVMGAGAFMNFVLAIALFSVALMIPREVAVGQAAVAAVIPGSPAAEAGLKPGDTIVSIGGRKIESVSDASYNIRLNLGDRTQIVVLRNDPATGQQKQHTLYVRPRWAPPPFEYTVQPGDDVDKAARALGFERAAVRQAAGIETRPEVGKNLVIQASGETLTHAVKEGETIESIARSQRVSEEAVAAAAGLPDPNRLEAGTVLRFQQGATGITIAPLFPYTETRALGPWEALQRGWRSTFDALKLARNEIISWTKGGAQAPVSGPIGIAQATGEVVKEAGWRSLVDLAAMLSINLAVLNILPLPMLDGGRMAFVFVEMLRRGKRIAPAREALVHILGGAAILILVVVLSYFDIARIVRGDSLFR